MVGLMRVLLQEVVILLAKPYVKRELPGWGSVFALVAGFKRDWLWVGAPEKVTKGKMHNYIMHLKLDRWPERSAFFLDRWYDLSTQLVVRDLVKQGDAVFDIGANNGMFALVASRAVGPVGKVICFEPNPACVAHLEREVRTNDIGNVTVHQCGLGDREGEFELMVPLTDSGAATFGKDLFDHGVDSYAVSVPVRIGDELLSDETPALIKIDVEGFEEWVLTGLMQTLRKHRPIVITEIFGKALRGNGSSPEAIFSLMEGIGYQGFLVTLARRRAGFDWILTRTSGDQEHHFDVVWVHESAIDRVRSRIQ